MLTAHKIISEIEKHYPTGRQEELKNSSDLKITNKENVLYQFIIGFTSADKMHPGSIDHYKISMKENLSKVTSDFDCLPWPCEYCEKEDIKSILKELSDHFGANLDIEEMIKSAKFKKDDGDLYFIVITVIPIVMLYIE